jgi:hypothetical protein
VVEGVAPERHGKDEGAVTEVNVRIFLPQNRQKMLASLIQKAAFVTKIDHAISFKINADFFAEKLVKIDKNSDHSIGPCKRTFC